MAAAPAGSQPENMPERIDRYVVRAFLGRRGRLHVYQVFDPRLRRDLAITILAPIYAATPRLQARFRAEVSRLANLTHEAIVPVYDFGEWEDHPYIVMPHMVGGSLTARRLARRLPLPDIAKSIERAAAALAAAYAFDVSHGRIQPSSLLYNAVNEAHLTDFISSLAPPTLDADNHDRGLRPAHFLSPERAAMALADLPSPSTPADDVYALGAVLYFALAGRPPFVGDTPGAICEAHINDPRPDLPPELDEVPAAVKLVIRIALARDRAARYSDPTVMAEHLRDSVAGRLYWPNVNAAPASTGTGPLSPPPRTTGQRLGRYELSRVVGRGRMGVVYLAYDPELRRTVALKVLPGRFLETAYFHERFRREAELVAGLGHPAIVPVYNLGAVGRRPFIVMPFMKGGTLTDRLAGGPLPPPAAVEIIDRVAAALMAAHDQGIVHRDVKPANILFDANGEAYLADFGIALLQAAATMSAPAGGTPKYMSPEQVAAFLKHPGVRIDHRSDIYSLGVVLYHLLAGRPPFHEGGVADIAQAHLRDEPPPLPGRSPGDRLTAVVTQALAKDPAGRFQTAGELAAALRAAAS